MANSQFKTMDEYIATFPAGVQAILEKMRETIRRLAPDAREAISYQLPTFKLNGRNLIHFGAWQDHIGVYPVTAGNESFRKELAPYVEGKGTIRFRLNEPIPYDLLKKIVALRVEDVKSRQGSYLRRKSAASQS